MIIDVHAHVLAAPQLYAWKATLLGARGAHGFVRPNLPAELVRDHPETKKNLAIMETFGTDLQLISPRPFMAMHGEKPVRMVQHWTMAVNDYIAELAGAYPTRFAGVCGLPQVGGEPVTVALAELERCITELGFVGMAVNDYIAELAGAYPTRFAGVCGLPQVGGEPVTVALAELERCITELGFVGTLLDTDPGEGDNSTPTLDDEYWYPLYEKLCALDVPALIHSTGCKWGRETYSMHFISEESLAVLSLANSRVFLDFPTLKIIVAHGGGSIPYQVGRWRAERLHPQMNKEVPLKESFDDSLRRLYFDTVLHNRNSLEMLIKLVGSDRVMFGTENPGSGSAIDPETGRQFDDIKPLIEEIPGLTAADRHAIFEGNARRVFSRLKLPAAQEAE